MSDIKRPRPPSDRGICPVCRQDQALVMTGADAGTLRSHGKPTCPGTRQAPKAPEAPPLVAALTPPHEPPPSPGEPVAPASLPPIGSVVRVGSADSDPGQVLRHLGDAFVLAWADGEQGEYSPADIVPDPEAAPAWVPKVGDWVALKNDPDAGVMVVTEIRTSFADTRTPDGERWTSIATSSLVPSPPMHMRHVLDEAPAAEVSAAPPSEPATTPADPPTEPDELPEGVARLGLPVERREDDRAAEQWRAAALRALLPDGAELAQVATGWRLTWPAEWFPEMGRPPIEAADLHDLLTDLMADASPVPKSAPTIGTTDRASGAIPAYDRFIGAMCVTLNLGVVSVVLDPELAAVQGRGLALRASGRDRRRIEVLEKALDDSREEVGQLRARLAVATSPHRAAPSQPEVALRAALDLIAALRP